MSKLKNAVNLSKIIFSPIKFLKHIFNMSVTCLQSIEKLLKAPGGVGFHKVCNINHN